ncbi:hypothetical protein AYI68_g6041 [Smittium mucronatum]|uniref:DNA-directed RNA polymerase III subunit RPC3 n=1 Tax=Smittium mucronatum TaxID=133383 RepID=A0A1R0GSM4_9FUNG|nr:hypothetical protein AYI68_g6041 [Smittium mucronatum]
MFLLKRGRSEIGFIVSGTGLSRKQVTSCLIVLLQHSVATYFENRENGVLRVYYALNTSVLLRRPRIGLYLATIEERFGKMPGKIGSGFAANKI